MTEKKTPAKKTSPWITVAEIPLNKRKKYVVEFNGKDDSEDIDWDDGDMTVISYVRNEWREMTSEEIIHFQCIKRYMELPE